MPHAVLGMLVPDKELIEFEIFPCEPLLVMNSLSCTPLVALTILYLELSPETWSLLVTEEVGGSVSS